MLLKTNILLLLWLSIEVAYAFVSHNQGVYPRQQINARSVSATAMSTTETATATATGKHKSVCKARKAGTTTLKASASTTDTYPQCVISEDPDSGSGAYCVCSHSSKYTSFQLSGNSTSCSTIPETMMESLTASTTTTSATGPITITAHPTGYYPYTKWNLNGAVTACEGSSVGEVAGYPVTYCTGSTSNVSTAISYSTQLIASPNNVINYGNWSDWSNWDWYKASNDSLTSRLYSAFSTALCSLCSSASSTTVLSITTTSFDYVAETMSLIPTTTTMYMCADATAKVESVEFISDSERTNADLKITAPFSHFDPNNLQNWINLTSFALVGNAMHSGNTYKSKYEVFEVHESYQNNMIVHKGPSYFDLSYFDSLNSNMVTEQLQVQVIFQVEESEFDCEFMEIADLFLSALTAFDPELIGFDLEGNELLTLCQELTGTS